LNEIEDLKQKIRRSEIIVDDYSKTKKELMDLKLQNEALKNVRKAYFFICGLIKSLLRKMKDWNMRLPSRDGNMRSKFGISGGNSVSLRTRCKSLNPFKISS